MFDDALFVANWLFSEVSKLAGTVWSFGWIGVCVIGLPLVRKAVNIFKSIF